MGCGHDELLLERGYSGHEHLPQFGLINKNARFLSLVPEPRTTCYGNLVTMYIDPYPQDFKEFEQFKELYKRLSAKMRPMVYELGFLRKSKL